MENKTDLLEPAAEATTPEEVKGYIAPSTQPKYFLVSRQVYGWMDDIKKVLEGVLGGGAGGFSLSTMQEQYQTAAWFGVAMFAIWITRYWLGIRLDKCVVKDPL